MDERRYLDALDELESLGMIRRAGGRAFLLRKGYLHAVPWYKRPWQLLRWYWLRPVGMILKGRNIWKDGEGDDGREG